MQAQQRSAPTARRGKPAAATGFNGVCKPQIDDVNHPFRRQVSSRPDFLTHQLSECGTISGGRRTKKARQRDG